MKPGKKKIRSDQLAIAYCTLAVRQSAGGVGNWSEIMGKRKVINAVKKQLKEVGPGIQFDIVEAGVRAEHEWWHVPVLSHKTGKTSGEK
jgi:hypothetical protein